jgi:hypothetical protein
MAESKGLRFNEGKARYDLLPAFAVGQMTEVMTYGSKKYAERNWEKGMEWSKITSSLKRHLAAIEAGEDYDPETGLLHSAHVMTNAAFLTEYYKIAPHYDDRPKRYMKRRKIGLDIDGVLADFSGHIVAKVGLPDHKATHWNDPIIREAYDSIRGDKEFWSTIPVLNSPTTIPFEPHCYITARSIDPEVTQSWLDNNGFPKAKLYCVGHGESKIEVAKSSGIDTYVDDNFDNFLDLTGAGILCYLFDAPYNQWYNVGHRRIKSLMELK